MPVMGVAAIVGLALFFGGVTLPTLVARPLTIIGDLTTPLSMAIIGAILSRMRLKSMVGNPRIYATSAYRLVVFPLLVYAVLFSLGFRGRLLAMPVVIAAMPAAANSAILAKAYGGDAETASSLIFVTTLASLVTIPLLAAIFAA
jgi:predicted permease